jgi:hypothetical protein
MTQVPMLLQEFVVQSALVQQGPPSDEGSHTLFVESHTPEQHCEPVVHGSGAEQPVILHIDGPAAAMEQHAPLHGWFVSHIILHDPSGWHAVPVGQSDATEHAAHAPLEQVGVMPMQFWHTLLVPQLGFASPVEQTLPVPQQPP